MPALLRGMNLGPHAHWGSNAEQVLLHSAWKRGFGAAFTRMVDQARKAGAHGVIGVSDSRQAFADTPAVEYRVTGTAVRVAGAEASTARPWTTHFAGQRLVNAIEGGFMPISAVVQRCWMAVWPYCLTEFFLVGKLTKRDLMGEAVQEVVQVSDAKMKLVEIATGHVRNEAESDAVLGLDVEWGDTHLGFGAWVMNVTLRGARVRRFRSELNDIVGSSTFAAVMTGPSPDETLRNRMLAGQAAAARRSATRRAPSLAAVRVECQ